MYVCVCVLFCVFGLRSRVAAFRWFLVLAFVVQRSQPDSISDLFFSFFYCCWYIRFMAVRAMVCHISIAGKIMWCVV